ncbi:hypothetical protein SBA2_240008 [Acidobacteriia bacterium SbA2]|nr:hypothetical protein SBA2_240008 [Acidobacteriia bacterium SbA2]
MKDIGRSESRPSLCENFGRRSKIVATPGKGSTVDRSSGRASYDRKRIAVRLNSFYLANAFKNTGLISAASTFISPMRLRIPA